MTSHIGSLDFLAAEYNIKNDLDVFILVYRLLYVISHIVEMLFEQQQIRYIPSGQY